MCLSCLPDFEEVLCAYSWQFQFVVYNIIYAIFDYFILQPNLQNETLYILHLHLYVYCNIEIIKDVPFDIFMTALSDSVSILSICS